ncbi:hypothetical protein TPHA_0F01660 [Tetrapisispora phaffii CBS 4417]|uniref:Uncharacterized protein n=1 Tax=Tetrapisispora phaffii (strain ATCC 24235 / CBS 4417 / NBRC 1672 / NRRL Y-8282 / UCD 70-5) TaxID=1071381 RepID=G8BV68_TETPH|nr:hypothetical protein TPHA_0F01660 [Tetrapisispora phaffii CBS 4417]CCE63650.1 hypothetical protein TPHA_0F01660 [Tetrapisispora phaffii CBS 4417]
MSDVSSEEVYLEEASLWQENVRSLVAGGVGGVCAVLTGHPFDLVKVRLQNNQASSTVDAIKKILIDVQVQNRIKFNPINYFKGFYKGVIPPLVGVTPIFAVSFWGYDVGKKIVSYTADSSNSNNSLSNPQLAMAGFLSAIPTTLVTAPTERIKVVLQTQQPGVKNSSMISAATRIVKEGGVKSLFKGSLATLARDGPGSALYFGSYEVSKKFLNSRSSNNNANGDEVNLLNVCLSGGIAGMSMWVVVFPIDTIKTKLQAGSTKTLNGGRVNMVSVAKEIYFTKGGLKGFFPGIGPALLRSFPANAATFLGVELTHSLIKNYNL